MSHVVKQKGFTLVELMLAMGFISVLLLAIAMTVIQIGTIYNRGMTLKDINQTSRALSDDIRRSVSNSSSISLSTDYRTSSAGGRICLGSVSYIWNYSNALTKADPLVAKYDKRPAETLRLVRVPDKEKLYCAVKVDGSLANRNIRALDDAQAQELLKSGDKDLAIHQLNLVSQPSAQDPATAQRLYVLTFTIGTATVSALTPDQTHCLAPGDPGADPVYCNVQQFSLVLRAGNRVN